jgi:hypothetical protein
MRHYYKDLPASKRLPYLFFTQPIRVRRQVEQEHEADCLCGKCKKYEKLIRKLKAFERRREG